MNALQESPITLAGLMDRRESSRFPVQEEVQYRVVNNRGDKISGVGKTLDMSSSGILFTTTNRLQLGRLVEVAVNWPARLGGTCPLKFVALGRVVRSDATCAALRIERYEFRTRGTSPAPLSPV
jgi:hypothetical protein